MGERGFTNSGGALNEDMPVSQQGDNEPVGLFFRAQHGGGQAIMECSETVFHAAVWRPAVTRAMIIVSSSPAAQT